MYYYKSQIAFGSVSLFPQTVGVYSLPQIQLSAKSLTYPEVYNIVPAPKEHPA